MRNLWICLFLVAYCINDVKSQDKVEAISVKNPNFEFPGGKLKEAYWFDCGTFKFYSETPPDIMPNDKYGVTQKPYEGKNYLCMVLRDNGSYEYISTRLSSPLEAGKCYEFTLMLAHSNTLRSRSHKIDGLVLFDGPSFLSVYGSRGYCNEALLLAKSRDVTNNFWEKYTFTLKPTTEMKFITLKADYGEYQKGTYNSNVLIDKMSDIVEVPCGN